MFKISLHEALDLEAWFRTYQRGEMDMSPVYQRKAAIWGKWKQAHLLDSIINGFDIPKFYVGNFFEMPRSTLNKTGSGYSVIDGKQRFGAIFAFFKDELALNKSTTFDDDPTSKIGGLKYSELKKNHPIVAARIENFIPAVMSVVTDSEEKIRELFIRLNMGEAANGAEQRNALGGPVPEIVRELSMHPFFTKKIRFGTGRMQDHNLIAKILLLEFSQKFVDTKKSDLDRFAHDALKLVDDSAPLELLQQGPYVEAKERVLNVLEILTPEFEERDKLLSSAGNIPVYYWWARNHPRRANEIRDFLVYLTQEIKNARDAQKTSQHANQKMIEYYTSSRTTNDRESLSTRYRLMCELFDNWLKPLPLRKF